MKAPKKRPFGAPRGRKKVGDDVGTTPSGRNVTVGGRVLDPTTGTTFQKGQPHPTPKPMSIKEGFLQNFGGKGGIQRRPPAKPAPKPKSNIVGVKSRKADLDEIMSDRVMGGKGKKA